MDKYTEERYLALQNKFGIAGKLQLETIVPRSTEQVNLAQWIDEQESNERRKNGTILKTRTVAFGSAKPLRLFFEITPDR